MRDAPDRIWAVPEYNCTVYMSGNSPITARTGPFEHHRHGKAVAYVRADLSDALLREAVEALHQYVNDMRYPPERDSRDRRIAWARATLAKLRAHLDGETE